MLSSKKQSHSNVWLLILLMSIMEQGTAQVEREQPPLYGQNLEVPLALRVQQVAIGDKVGGPLPGPATADGSLEFAHRFGNGLRNSRVAFSPSGEMWKVAWHAPLPAGMIPTSLRVALGHIVVQSDDVWVLVDMHGKQVGTDAIADCEVTIDPAAGRLMAQSPDGLLGAYDIGTAKRTYAILPTFGSGFSREVVSAAGQMQTLVSHEIAVMNPKTYRDPDYCLVETYSVGQKVTTDELGIATNAAVAHSLTVRSRPVVVGSVPDGFRVAMSGYLIGLDNSLAVTSCLTGEFRLLTASFDEAHRSYLIVREIAAGKESTTALWVVNDKGERVSRSLLPESERYMPPIVGFDHTVFMILGTRLMAITPRGATKWEITPGGPGIAGAVATPDGSVLVSADSVLCAIDANGERTVIHAFSGDVLTTAPVPVSDRKIVVAGGSTLYCLERQ